MDSRAPIRSARFRGPKNDEISSRHNFSRNERLARPLRVSGFSFGHNSCLVQRTTSQPDRLAIAVFFMAMAPKPIDHFTITSVTTHRVHLESHRRVAWKQVFWLWGHWCGAAPLHLREKGHQHDASTRVIRQFQPSSSKHPMRSALYRAIWWSSAAPTRCAC